jgi:hypothetical protein
MMRNETYVGRLIYAKTRERKVRVGEGVKRRKVPVPEAERAVCEGAHEAIVDPETWARVQAKFALNKGKSFGQRGTLTEGGRTPASVLSGIVHCACCGKRLVVWGSGPNPKQRRKGTGQTQKRFVCGRRYATNKAGCDNAVSLEMRQLETAVLNAFEQQVLTEDFYRLLEGRRRQILLETLAGDRADTRPLRDEEARLRLEERRLVEAVRAGLPLPTLRSEAERVQMRLTAIQADLAQAERRAQVDLAQVDAHLVRTRLDHLRDVLHHDDLSEVRAALRKALVAVEVTPDGALSLLLGEGVLGTNDLPEAPQGRAGAALEAPPSVPSDQATPGLPPVSLVCVVGATGFEPATS